MASCSVHRLRDNIHCREASEPDLSQQTASNQATNQPTKQMGGSLNGGTPKTPQNDHF